jgi:ABC-2 type transport system permease protein
MLSMLRSEYRKIVTIRTSWVLLITGPLLVVAGISGVILNGDLRDPVAATSALSHTGIAALTSLIFGILGTAGEYRHGTITDTYLSFPRRQRVLTAKLTVYALAGLVYGVASAVTALAMSLIGWSARGYSFPVGRASTWGILGGGILVNVAFAVLGAGLGALVRNVVVAITAALAWIAVVETIMGQLIGSSLSRWLPFASSESLDGVRLSGPGGVLPAWGGATLLIVYAALFATAAYLLTLGRDVT